MINGMRFQFFENQFFQSAIFWAKSKSTEFLDDIIGHTKSGSFQMLVPYGCLFSRVICFRGCYENKKNDPKNADSAMAKFSS